MTWTQEKVNETYLRASNLAAKDKAFRAELLSNPNAAVEKLAGEPLPENFNIKIIESDPTYSATFVLPLMLSNDLSDDELAAVAGGVTTCDTKTCGGQTVK
jgi:hypothetical protein